MIYMMLADGFEETEAIATLDVIRRSGAEIKTAGINGTLVCGTHSVKVNADIAVEDIDINTVDGIILPGGMPGTTNLMNNEYVNKILDICVQKGYLVAAICAAPMILGEKGLLDGKSAVCYPGFEKHLKGAVLSDKAVAVSGNIITGKGAGASLEFGAAIVDFVLGKSGEGEKILAGMQYPL